MTHSLHRQGSIGSLKNDFVMYARCSRGINLDGAEPKVRRIVEIVFDEGPTNAGDSPHHASIADGRLTREKALEYQKDTRGFICCFNDRQKMTRVLERLKEENLGISIVVSGLIDDVMEMAREVGLKPHTVNLSLGIRGRKDLLPAAKVLEFTTMCGHGLVPTNLVKKAIADVDAGKMSLEEAARMVGKPCICGIVNLVRAAEMLRQDAVHEDVS
jgi:hypothetical protein